ncbi:MAG: SusF/SusE family outer membrane protein, partial [Daejeonella sp.]|nr:SusF/SusE family outer membrane protein [Daejeonella sp.]
MKTLINNFVGFSAILILLIGCKKEIELPVMEAVSFTAGVTANASNITLSEANGKTNVVTFTWPTVTYPVAAPVTYTLQIDVPADTIGAANWGNAKSIEVGNDVLTKSILGDQLNTIALNLGIEAGKTGTI